MTQTDDDSDDPKNDAIADLLTALDGLDGDQLSPKVVLTFITSLGRPIEEYSQELMQQTCADDPAITKEAVYAKLLAVKKDLGFEPPDYHEYIQEADLSIPYNKLIALEIAKLHLVKLLKEVSKGDTHNTVIHLRNFLSNIESNASLFEEADDGKFLRFLKTVGKIFKALFKRTLGDEMKESKALTGSRFAKFGGKRHALETAAKTTRKEMSKHTSHRTDRILKKGKP